MSCQQSGLRIGEKRDGEEKRTFHGHKDKKKQKTKVLIGFLGEVFSNIEIDRSTIKLKTAIPKKNVNILLWWRDG